LTTAVIGVAIGRKAESGTRDQIRRSLHSQAVLLRDLAVPHIDSPIDSTFQRRVWLLGARAGTRLTVIRADGVVIADSQNDPAGMDNHARRPEVRAALTKGLGVSTRYSRTLREDFMYLALPIESGSDPAGFVRTSIPLTAVHSRLDEIRSVVFLGAIGVAAFALLVGFYFTGRVTRPLVKMTRVADAIAGGDYNQRMRLSRTDEIGALANALDTMTARLGGQISTITSDRNKMLAILSGMVEGMVAIDREDRIVHINDAAERILCISGENCVGKRIWEATRVREVCEALDDAMRQEHVTIGEARIVAAQEELVIQLIATPFRDANANLAGALVVLHDVSELRKLETIRRDFIANISHELKTPLAAIRGLVETMIDDGDMDPETHDRFLDKIRRQSTRLARLVSDLLTISKLESDDATKDFRTVDFREPLSESLRAVLPVAQNKRLTLEHEIPDEPVPVVGDSEALRELVDNLAGNAVKYTPAGGRVRVTLRRDSG
jgi:two-component system phosphate regulon sensor histidine kinase PhoR